MLFDITESELKGVLDELLFERVKRVIRGGTLIKKQVAKKGFKLVKKAGGKITQKRMSVAEKRNRHIAMVRSWKSNKVGRVKSTLRHRVVSMRKRAAVFGK